MLVSFLRVSPALEGRARVDCLIRCAKWKRSARESKLAQRNSTEIADEDYVAALVAFGEQQLPAVAGPGKIKNAARGKVRDPLRVSAD